MNRDKLLQVMLLIARAAIAIYFLFAGWSKVRSEVRSGVGTFYRGDFTQTQPEWVPGWLGAPYGYALPWLEVAVGLLLLIGLFSRITAGLMSLMLLSYCIAFAANENLFVFQSHYNAAGPYHANIIFLSLTLLLMITGPGRFSVDHVWRNKPRG